MRPLQKGLRTEAGATEGRTPKGRIAALKEEGRTPWKTPPPVFADPKTPTTAVPASGWQQLCSETGAGPPHKLLAAASRSVILRCYRNQVVCLCHASAQ